MRPPLLDTMPCKAFLSVVAAVLCVQSVVNGKQDDTNAEAVTFSRQIAPLIYTHCTTCHRRGEAAPFELLTYADARKHAKDIADLTERRAMPPWKAEHGIEEFVGAGRRIFGQSG